MLESRKLSSPGVLPSSGGKKITRKARLHASAVGNLVTQPPPPVFVALTFRPVEADVPRQGEGCAQADTVQGASQPEPHLPATLGIPRLPRATMARRPFFVAS